MHLVFLNQYYPPDAAPTGVMLEAVVARLVAEGHQVTVLCASGGYAGGEKLQTLNFKSQGRGQNSDSRDQNPEGPPTANRQLQTDTPPTIMRIGATRFGRRTFLGKLLDYLSYYLGASWKLATMKDSPDRIVALTTPPYLSVVARLVSKFRGSDHAHWVMDLYPDVMVAHGMLAERSLKYRILSGLARWGFGGKRCAGILTLGTDMADRVATLMGRTSATDDPQGDFKNDHGSLIRWVPLWGSSEVSVSSASDEKDLRVQRGWSDDDLIVMYSGNMGLGHRFQEFLLAAQQLTAGKDGRIRLVFFGEGKRRGEIANFIKEHPQCAVELHGYAPSEILDAHLRSGDVHLVSLEPEWMGTMVPSKLQGIFAVGRPVIFVGPPESSIGRWVEESGGGWVVEPNDINGIMAAITEAAVQAIREERRQAALAFANSHFDRFKNSGEVAASLALGNGARDRTRT